MGPKSKAETAILSVVSFIALLLMLAQLRHNDWSVDLWVIVAFGIGALPWFWRVLESVDFPGGGGLKLRELERAQQRQGEEIQALEFLLARYLKEPEREFLRHLANGEPMPLRSDSGAKLFEEVNEIRRTGLISIKPGMQQAGIDVETFNQIFEVTESGHRYLELLDKLPTEDTTSSEPITSEASRKLPPGR